MSKVPPLPDPLPRCAGERGTGLTPREKEVLRRIADGEPSKVIASELGISIKTVECHRRNLYGKLGVHSIAGAVRAAIKILML